MEAKGTDDNPPDPLAGCFELSVLLATGLPRVNILSKPNAFVSVKFDDKLVGKTEVVEKSVEPVWNSKYVINIPQGKDISTCVLEIFVYNMKPDDSTSFLGYRKITGSELLYLSTLGSEEPEDNNDDANDDDSSKDKDDMASVKHYSAPFDLHTEPRSGQKQKPVKGKIVLWGNFHPHPPVKAADPVDADDDASENDTTESGRSLSAYLTLQVQIIAARDIANANSKGSISGSSNPFGIIKINGEELYRTPVIGNTLSPHWHNETIDIRIPVNFNIMTATFECELWHSNNPRKRKRSKFLGTTYLRSDEFCKLSGCIVADVMYMQEEVCKIMRSYYEENSLTLVLPPALLRSVSRPSSPGVLCEPGNMQRSPSGAIRRQAMLNDQSPSVATYATEGVGSPIRRAVSGISTKSMGRGLVDIYDKGMPQWIGFVPSVQRTALENALVQGEVKMCFNFKLPPDRVAALQGLPAGFRSHRVGDFEVISPRVTADTKKQPVIVVNILSIKGQIIKEAVKLKKMISVPSAMSAEDVSDMSSKRPKEKSLEEKKLEELAKDDTLPPQMFCVIRDMFGKEIGKTLPLSSAHCLRWQEERFWLPFPSRLHELFPVLFTIEVYCVCGTGHIESLGVTSISAESVLEAISDPQTCLGPPGGIGPYGEFRGGNCIRWFDLDAPYFSDDEGDDDVDEGLDSTPHVSTRDGDEQPVALVTSGRQESMSMSRRKLSLQETGTSRRMAIAGLEGGRRVGPLGSIEVKIQARSPQDLAALNGEESAKMFEEKDDEDGDDQTFDDELVSVHSETEDAGTLNLTLGAVTGMGIAKSKRQIFGKKISKVYCIVWANGVCIGRTSTVKLTAETQWKESFAIHLPGTSTLENSHVEIEMFKETPTKISTENPSGVLTYSAGVIELRGIDLVRLCEHEKSDEDKEPHNGAAVEDIDEEQEPHDNDLCFPLVESHRTFSFAAKPSAIIGCISLSATFEQPHRLERLAYVSHDEDDHLDRELQYTPALLELTIFEAANLANADRFGMSDPFVIVIWNDEEFGRTYVINDTLNPVWSDQVFQLPVPRYQDILSCKLELHMYDDQTVGKNQFLGCHTLSGKSLQKVLVESGGDTSPVWLDLKPSKSLSKKQNKLVQGSVLIQCRFTQSHRTLRRWSVDHVKIEAFAFSAEDLSKIEMRRKPNCFLVFFFNNAEIGRTSVVRKAVNPQWDTDDDSCRFTIYLPEDQVDSLSAKDLEIAVYHSDLGKETELLQNCICLGRAYVKGRMLDELLTASKKSPNPPDIIPMRVPVEGFTRGSTKCRADTFNKTTPQGMLDIGILINDSENHREMAIEMKAFQEDDVSETTRSVTSADLMCTPEKSSVISTARRKFGRDSMGQSRGISFAMTEDSRMDESLNPDDFALTTSVLDPNVKRSAYKMHLHESGSFYYLNESTLDSSWDRPTDGAVELYYSPEQLSSMSRTRAAMRKARVEEFNKLKAAVAVIRAEHDEQNHRIAMEKKRHDDRVIYMAWQKALSLAAEENGECNISWQKCTGIDSMVYDFEATFKKPLKAIRLVGVQLTMLPDEFCCRLYGIQVLSLANNDLTSLPESLYKMYNVHYLNLRNNKLKSLPEKIGLMATNLSRIELSNNKLESLPATFAALVKIKRLDLEHNCIERLPENLDLLYNCEVLNVSCNRLTRLPRCIGRMKSLISLSANRNCINYIPLEVCKSRSLEVLRLCTNKITALPENIGQFRKLRELWLDHNYLSFLPVTFCQLVNLQLFRIEENRSLEAPDQDILREGAQAVVQWAHRRYMEDGAWRRKRIIVTLQDCLSQITAMKTYDNSLFEPAHKMKDDLWYALDLKYFWNFILPELQKKWKKMIDNYDTIPKNIVLSFPYSKKDVMWALRSFQDAYGYVYSLGTANFRRCSCVDENGRRRPCVPPVKGYMCRRKCALIKHQAVLEHERELRLWRAHVAHEINEAVKRAEKEALKFLQSLEGRLWIAQMSFERAEEAMNGKGIHHALDWREKLVEKRKKNIIKKFDRKKKKVLKRRDGNSSALLIEIEELKQEVKRSQDGGYAKVSANEKLAQAYEELANLPENDMLRELQEECERECEAVEDDLLYTDSSSEEDNYQRESYTARKQREAKEAEEAALAAVEGTAMIPEMPPTPPRSSVVKDVIFGALDVIPPKDRREVLLRRQKRRTKRFLRNTFDMVNMRVTKMRLMMGGDFKEMQQELEHETYVQYISNAAAVARRRAERDFYVLGRIRNQWKGLGMELCFREWKKWVRTKTKRNRADLRKTWRLEKKQYECDLITYHLAKAQLSMWEKFTDVYSDKPFWKNWQSGDMTWDEPLVEDYIPAGCGIPKKPTPLPIGMSEDTSDESEEDEYYRPRVKDDDEGDTKASSSVDLSNHLLKDEADLSMESQSVVSEEAPSELTDDNPHGGDLDSLDSNERSVHDTHRPMDKIGPDSVGSKKVKPYDPNDFSRQRWEPLVSSSLSSSAHLPMIMNHTMSSTSATALASAARRNSSFAGSEPPLLTHISRTQSRSDMTGALALRTDSTVLARTDSKVSTNRHSSDRMALVPSSDADRMLTMTDELSKTSTIPTYRLQGPGEKVVLPVYSYGPDSLRAGGLQGRVGRPLFPDASVMDNDDDDETLISTEEAARLLDSYSTSGESVSPSLQLARKGIYLI